MLVHSVERKLVFFFMFMIFFDSFQAALAAATENLDAREITMSHFNRALEQVRPSLTTDQIKNYVIFESDHRGG